jgi:hypothetical protein
LGLDVFQARVQGTSIYQAVPQVPGLHGRWPYSIHRLKPVLPSRAEAVHDLSGRCMQLLPDRSRRLDNLNFALRSGARSIATFYSASSFDIGLLAKVGLRPGRLQVTNLPNHTVPAANRFLSDRYCSLPTNNSKSVKVKWQLSSDT